MFSVKDQEIREAYSESSEFDYLKSDENTNQTENTKPEEIKTPYLKTLQPSCHLTDIPDDIIDDINMSRIHFTPTTVSSFQHLCDNQIKGRFRSPDMFAMLCARRWKSQHVQAWCRGNMCSHFSEETVEEIGSG